MRKPIGTVEPTKVNMNKPFDSAQGLKYIDSNDVGVGDMIPVLQNNGTLVWGEVTSITDNRHFFVIDCGPSWIDGMQRSWAYTYESWKPRIASHICTRDGHEPADLGGLIKSWCVHCDTTLWYWREHGEFFIEDPFSKGA